MSFNGYWVSSYREEATLDTSNMMAITNLTDEEKQTETFQKKKTCSPSLAGGLQYKPIYLSTVNILLLITAFHGNFLILAALHRESSLHPRHRPNTCIVVWQQLICWLVLLASPSVLFIKSSWFTNDTQGTQPT